MNKLFSYLRTVLQSADAKAARLLDAFHAPQGRALRAAPAPAAPKAQREQPIHAPPLLNARAFAAAAGASGGRPLAPYARDLVPPASAPLVSNIDDLVGMGLQPPAVDFPPPRDDSPFDGGDYATTTGNTITLPASVVEAQPDWTPRPTIPTQPIAPAPLSLAARVQAKFDPLDT